MEQFVIMMPEHLRQVISVSVVVNQRDQETKQSVTLQLRELISHYARARHDQEM